MDTPLIKRQMLAGIYKSVQKMDVGVQGFPRLSISVRLRRPNERVPEPSNRPAVTPHRAFLIYDSSNPQTMGEFQTFWPQIDGLSWKVLEPVTEEERASALEVITASSPHSKHPNHPPSRKNTKKTCAAFLKRTSSL